MDKQYRHHACKTNDLHSIIYCRSRRHPKEVLADLDFADDIALLSDAVQQAQELLLRVETECSKVGLGLNGPKTKYLTYNIDGHPPLVRHSPLSTRNGTVLEQKSDFKYLGSWVGDSEGHQSQEGASLESPQRHG